MSVAHERFLKCKIWHLATRAVERGYSMEEVKPCIVKQDGDDIEVDIHHSAYPYKDKRVKKDMKRAGAGTELKKLLKFVGITASPNCSCNARAARMDDEGIQWCKDNVDKIVSWLKEEASKRHLPFANFIGRRIVKLAISRAEKSENANK